MKETEEETGLEFMEETGNVIWMNLESEETVSEFGRNYCEENL